MRRSLLFSLALLVTMVTSCGADDGDATPSSAPGAPVSVGHDPTGTETPTGTDSVADIGTGPTGGLADQFGVRYCEVLTITIADTGTTAEVWGTQGLNDCPDDAFAGIESEAIAAEMAVSIAVPNGPRYWVLDDIVARGLAGSGERREFNGIEMRSIALVDLGEGVPDRRPYTEHSVERDTEFRFDEGREIHELRTPDGSVYVMQSYSVEVDPALTIGALASLGDRLALPEGWAFTSRVLDEELVVESLEGTATVVQDELTNSYQLHIRG